MHTKVAERAWARPLLGALLLVLVSLAAACGPDGDEGTTTAGADDDTPVGARSPVTVASDGDPQSGGKVIYALEAETDGWDPTTNRWAVSGVQVGLTIFDPLAAFDEDGTAQPYLAQSITPNEDYTQWTIALRPGVQFHNGTPLTAEALRASLQAVKDSSLTGAAVQPIDAISVAGDGVVVSMSTPWVAFPAALTGQAGVVVEPDNLTSGTANSAPIGTGPFRFESWSPDNELVVTRNDQYWRTGLPYLDEVEFRPVPDNQTRAAGMRSGDYDMMWTSDTSSIVDFRELADEGEVQIVEDQSEPEEMLVLLNTRVEPLDDHRIRQALAYATDQDQIIEVTGESLYEPATGPYPESSPWYAESGYPTYDPERARQLVDEYVAENGSLPEFDLTTTPDASNLRIVELLAEQWGQVGITARPGSTDQASFILTAVTGNYDANLWRQYNAPDPDLDWHWWHGSNALGIDQVALNFTRLDDQELNAALDVGRQSPDETTRREAYATVQQRMGDRVDKVWLYHAIVAVVADVEVRGITNGPLPDGAPSMPMGGTFNGATRMTQVWIDG
jgi:4-phytase/acid phosphatase/peptide/nickel transport system substrate-binding protein